MKLFSKAKHPKEVKMLYQGVEMDPRVFAVLQNAKRWMLTGSRAIVSPPPEGRDMDVLVLAPVWGKDTNTLADAFWTMVEKNGFQAADAGTGSRDVDAPDETALYVLTTPTERVDLIITSDEAVYDRWETATKVCQALNIKERKHRVMVFRAIRTGKFFPPEDKEVKHAVCEAGAETGVGQGPTGPKQG